MTPSHVLTVLNIPLASPSADATGIAGGFSYLHRKFKVLAVHIINGAAIAADNANYVLLNLKAGASTVASLDTRAAGNGALVSKTAKAMTMVDANAEVPAGSTLTVDYDETDAGTNVALTSAVLVVSGYWMETA
jgi:hypothetical protein